MIIVTKICDHCKKEFSHLYEWPKFRINGDIISISQMGYYQYCRDCSAALIEKINTWQEIKDDRADFIKLMAENDRKRSENK